MYLRKSCKSVVALLIFSFVILILTGGAARAEYPDKPITIIVPWVPGGASDVTPRSLLKTMSEELKQPVVIINRPGASGVVGTLEMERAAPDGYTIGTYSYSQTLTNFTTPNPPSLANVVPIAKVMYSPATLTVKGSEIAAFTPEELERYLAQRVAEIIYDQGGPGLAAVLPSQSGEMPDLGPITILSPATHQSLGRVAQVLGIIALVLLLPLLFFSASFGRMGSPGCVLSIASFPGAILAFLLTMAPVSSGPIKPAASTTELLGSLLALSLPVAAKAALPGYALPLAVGLALVTLAFLTDRLWRWLRRPRHPEQPLTS